MSTISSSSSTTTTQSTNDRNRTTTNTNTRATSSTGTTQTSPAASTSNSSATSTTDRVSLSNESRNGSGSEGASLSLLDGLRDNFANDQAAKEPAKADAGDNKDGKTTDQKLDSLKSTIDSLKGLKGDELKAKLDEIKKTDPELAEYLEKMLAKDEKAEDKKETSEAKPAEKAQDKKADDGPPSETFLWKPESDSDGKLVILLPSSISASSVSISGPSGIESVEKGGRNGSRGNGQREHYRFSKSGKDMQGPVQVTVALESGGTKTISIAKPSERNEGGKLGEGQ